MHPTNNFSQITDPMELTDELAVKFLEYLSPRELGICSRVSKNWNRLASDTNLWAKFFSSANISFEKTPDNIKSYFTKIVISNKDELLANLNYFASSLNKDTQAQFVCFYFNSNSRIEIRVGKVQSSGPYGLTRTYTGNPTFIQHFVYRDKFHEEPTIESPKEKKQEEALSLEDFQNLSQDQQMKKLFENNTNRDFISSTHFTNGIQLKVLENIPSDKDSIHEEINSIFEDRLKELTNESHVHHEPTPRNGYSCQFVTAAAIAILASLYFVINSTN
ncbi:MAG: hypothetical protein K1000chlam2_01558 [Chlamydiae bacterium]|nr:hypothetical protein [Chlamydiota bacterium]